MKKTQDMNDCPVSFCMTKTTSSAGGSKNVDLCITRTLFYSTWGGSVTGAYMKCQKRLAARGYVGEAEILKWDCCRVWNQPENKVNLVHAFLAGLV